MNGVGSGQLSTENLLADSGIAGGIDIQGIKGDALIFRINQPPSECGVANHFLIFLERDGCPRLFRAECQARNRNVFFGGQILLRKVVVHLAAVGFRFDRRLGGIADRGGILRQSFRVWLQV